MSEASFPSPRPEAPPALWRLRSDEQLARRASQGDERAFGEIFRRYADKLYRFCLAMTGSPQDAQDALQNAMVKALRALPGEQREIELKPWLYKVARNESIEIMRKRRRSEPLDPERLIEGGVAEAAEIRERLRVLLADLDLLPERQRAVLLMRELAGLEFADIGAAYEASPAAMRQTLYEARLGLRALEQGRERPCADVQRELSDGDRRALRSLKARAHLRSCPDCRAFGEAIAERRRDLAGLAPLPAAASLGLLRSLLGGSGGGGGSGGTLAGTLSPAAQALAAPAAVKSAAAAALVVTAIGIGTADRAQLIHLPFGGGGGAAKRPATSDGERHAAAHPSARDAAAAEYEYGKPVGKHGTGAAPGGAERNTASSGPAYDHAGSQVQGTPGTQSMGGDPPGGGFGGAASESHGATGTTPPAAAHGQETAGSRKAPQAPASPPTGPPQGGPPPRSQAPPAGASPPKPPPAGPSQPPASAPPSVPAPPEGASPPEHPSGESGREVAPEAKEHP